MYYEETYEIEEIPGVWFKIKRIKPTRLFTYQTLLGQVFGGDSKKDNDETSLLKCYDFIMENTLFCKEKNGKYIEIQYPGLENTNLEEVETNPALVGTIVSLFINKVVNPVEKK